MDAVFSQSSGADIAVGIGVYDKYGHIFSICRTIVSPVPMQIGLGEWNIAQIWEVGQDFVGDLGKLNMMIKDHFVQTGLKTF